MRFAATAFMVLMLSAPVFAETKEGTKAPARAGQFCAKAAVGTTTQDGSRSVRERRRGAPGLQGGSDHFPLFRCAPAAVRRSIDSRIEHAPLRSDDRSCNPRSVHSTLPSFAGTRVADQPAAMPGTGRAGAPYKAINEPVASSSSKRIRRLACLFYGQLHYCCGNARRPRFWPWTLRLPAVGSSNTCA
jgi:hypothetical protein